MSKELIEAAREFKIQTNLTEAKIFDHSQIIKLMASFADQHAHSVVREREKEIAQELGYIIGGTPLTPVKRQLNDFIESLTLTEQQEQQ